VPNKGYQFLPRFLSHGSFCGGFLYGGGFFVGQVAGKANIKAEIKKFFGIIII
jgi:hypothetical protein